MKKHTLSSDDEAKNKEILSKKPFKKILLSPKFNITINELLRVNPKLIEKEYIDLERYDLLYSATDSLLEPVEGNINGKVALNAKKGQQLLNEFFPLAAYDESINKFMTLEGVAYLCSHSLVYLLDSTEYIPTSLVTIYFYTRSNSISKSANGNIIYTSDPSSESKRDYVRDKVRFMKENIPPNTLLLIDGPLIAGDWYVEMISAILNFFAPRNITPIFFVKNSTSAIITENISELIGRFNSDLHWAYLHLRNGERTTFFRYTDRINPRNSKVFCYIKALGGSPIRVEFHSITFEKIKQYVDDIMDIIYYLMLVQGDSKNPQIRPIAIAEKYARETLHLFDLEDIIRHSHLIPTINQERFGWS